MMFVIDNGKVGDVNIDLQREGSLVSYGSIARLRDEPNYGALSVYLVNYVIRPGEIHARFYTIDLSFGCLLAGDSTSAPSQTLAIQETPTTTNTSSTT